MMSAIADKPVLYAVGDKVRIIRSRGYCCGTLRNGTEGEIEQVVPTKYGTLYIITGGEAAYEKELSRTMD